jgi:uncharacterized protein YpmS
MNTKRFFRIILVVGILTLSSLACNLLNRISDSSIEPTPIPVTNESANNLRKDLSTAAEQLMAGEQVTLVIDESELTSLVAAELDKQSDPILYEPQIYLRDGGMQIMGKVLQGGFMVPAQLNLILTTNSDGQPQINIQTGKIGPLELPDSILEELTSQVDSAFMHNVKPRIKDIFVESILIADGLMTITGRRR